MKLPGSPRTWWVALALLLSSCMLVDTLVDLHAVDYAAVDLTSFGKPAGYLERQLRRMNQLWELARFREQPDIDAVGECAVVPPVVTVVVDSGAGLVADVEAARE